MASRFARRRTACRSCGRHHLIGQRLCVDQAVERLLARHGVLMPTFAVDVDRTPKVIGELLRCQCCVRVRCPWCLRYHVHGVGKDRSLLGYRQPDCHSPGEYELALPAEAVA